MVTKKQPALDAIGALGDPTRRAIFEALTERPQSVREVADRLPVTRPAVSQHLRVLKEAGLVREVAQGTRHIYHIDPRGIAAMRAWLDRQFARALDAFKAEAGKGEGK